MQFLEGRALHIVYCYADKAPIGPHGWYSAVADAEAIAKLKTGPNTGVATGAINGVVIVDIDPRNGGDKTSAEELSWLPPTRTHGTRSGGRHLIYKYPPQGIRNFQGREGRLPGIDILANGKGVLWPPSPGYVVVDDRPVTDFPKRLRELIETLTTTPRTPPPIQNGGNGRLVAGMDPLPRSLYFRLLQLVPVSDSVSGHDQRCVRGLLAVVVHAVEGTRDDRLNWASFRMCQYIEAGIVTRENAEKLLMQAASGYAASDGAQAAWATIQSGLGDGH